MPNTTTTQLSGMEDADDDFIYRWLMNGCKLAFDVSVGNGHSAQISASIDDRDFGPATDHLPGDGGVVEPLRGKVLGISADVRAGTQSPPPAALVTVTIWQQSAQAPGQRLVLQKFDKTGSFGTGNVCRLDFGIDLE
jgi:hypothetical protein